MISILGYDPENGIKSINTSRVPFARYLLPTALRKESASHKHSNIEIAFNSHKKCGETTKLALYFAGYSIIVDTRVVLLHIRSLVLHMKPSPSILVNERDCTTTALPGQFCFCFYEMYM